MTNDETKNEYATKDLHFAAFLQLRGMEVKKLEQYGGGREGRNPVYFIFGDRKECEELENIFWGGKGEKAMVNVRDYLTSVRDLRARVFSVSRLIRKKRRVS